MLLHHHGRLMMGAVEEMKSQVVQLAFATEAAQEEQEEMGPLWMVFMDLKMLEEMPGEATPN